MVNNTQPLPFYKEALYYTGLISLVAIGLLIYSIVGNNASNLMIPSIVIAFLFGGLTYFMWDTRCLHCKRPFVKKEDESKEKDLGTRNAKRFYVSEVYKTKDGEVVDKKEDYKMWPARFVQRFFYCKKCDYGKNDEWHDDEKGTFKGWENNNQWNPPKPKTIYVKENEDGEYKRISNGKKRVPIKQSVKRELFERADNACQLCGTNKRQLHIHHIDKNPSNNSKNNLIVVCAGCHSIAESLTKIQLQNSAKKPYKKSKTINIYK